MLNYIKGENKIISLPSGSQSYEGITHPASAHAVRAAASAELKYYSRNLKDKVVNERNYINY